MSEAPAKQSPFVLEQEKFASNNQGSGPEDEKMQQLRDLYRTSKPILKAALLKHFGQGPPDPDDVIQESFERLMRRKTFVDVRDLNAFLWRTARNLVLEFKRKKSTHLKYDFEVEQIFFPLRGENSSPESIYSAKVELETFNQALADMPPKRRRAFVLNKVEGLTVSAVARRMGISRTPAEKHVTKAMKDIAIALEKRGRGERS